MEKHWFNDREMWDEKRNNLQINDDEYNKSLNDEGVLIALWFEDRNEGWIKY